MGGNTSGALNVQGFTQSLQSNCLPSYHHITHSGQFNENYFDVGSQAKKLLQIHHGLAVSNCDLYDLPNRNHFISLFLKSSTDGQKRKTPLNIVVALDVSGSMNGPLTNSPELYEQQKVRKSRLDLSRQAILMLYSKLQANDVFSLVTFHNSAKTIIQSTYIKDLNFEVVSNLINSKFESGGTTIQTGFNEAINNISKFTKANTLKNYENRIVLLTDVNDNSVEGENKLIQKISTTMNISTTIIGVSTDFQSSTCQKLIKNKGFNYFCAVQQSDLQTYLVDQFDYTFFPCVYDVQISITSKNIKDISVFGSVDHDIRYEPEGNNFIVTKMKSGFPSDLQKNKTGNIQTRGGLILVKFIPVIQEELPDLKLTIHLSYSDLEGNRTIESYEISKVVEAEEYYSDQAIKKGTNLFYYVQTIRNLLRDMKDGPEDKVLTDLNKGFYLDKLNKLIDYCPQQKIQELQKLIQIVEKK